MTFNVYQQIGNGSIRELVVPNLDSTANYRFKVTASNRDGESPDSNIVEWGLSRVGNGSWWTQGEIGIINSLEDFESELPTGWWLSELVQSGVNPVTLVLRHYSADWDGGTNGSRLNSYEIPVADLTGLTLTLRDEVTIYPIKRDDMSGYQIITIKYRPYWEFSVGTPTPPNPTLLMFYIKDGAADTVKPTVAPAGVGTQLPAVDFIVMVDGQMLLKGYGNQWAFRSPDWAAPRYHQMSYPGVSDTQVSTVTPITHLQNDYPVTLDTFYHYPTPDHTPGLEDIYQTSFISKTWVTDGLPSGVDTPFPISDEFVLQGDQVGRGVFGTVTPLENVYLSYFKGSKVNKPNPVTPTDFTVPNSIGKEIMARATVALHGGINECITGIQPLSQADYPAGYTGAPRSTDSVTIFLSYYPYKGLPTIIGPQGTKSIMKCVSVGTNIEVSGFDVPIYDHQGDYGTAILSAFWIPDLSFATGYIGTGVMANTLVPTDPIDFGECTMIRWTMLGNIGWSFSGGTQVGSAQRRYYCDLPVGQFPVMADWILYESRSAPIAAAWSNSGSRPWITRTTYDPNGQAFPSSPEQDLPVWHWDGYYPFIHLDQRFRGPQTATPVRYRITLPAGDYVIRYLGADLGSTGTTGMYLNYPIAPLWYYDNGVTGNFGLHSPYRNHNGLLGIGGTGFQHLVPHLNLGTAAKFTTDAGIDFGEGEPALVPTKDWVIEITGPTASYFDIQPYKEIFAAYSSDDSVFTNMTDCFGQYVIRENMYVVIFVANQTQYSSAPAWANAPGVVYWDLPTTQRPVGFIGIHKMNRTQHTGFTNKGFADVGNNLIALKRPTLNTWALDTFNYGPFMIAQVQGHNPLNFAGSLTTLNSGGIAISSVPPIPPPAPDPAPPSYILPSSLGNGVIGAFFALQGTE